MRTVYVQELMRLPLGKQGENGAARIVWQGLAARYQALYGSGAFTLTAKRCGDAAAYPVAVSTEGGDVVWLVRTADVASPGSGSCELTYTVDGAVAKSQTWSTYVAASISGDAPGEPPEEPAKAWLAAIQAQIGNLDDLTTKAKASLVAAVNEAAKTGSGGGADIDLGMTGASAGQAAKVKAVEADGKPTAWEPADLPGGGTWELIASGEMQETANLEINKDNNGLPFSLKSAQIFVRGDISISKASSMRVSAERFGSTNDYDSYSVEVVFGKENPKVNLWYVLREKTMPMLFLEVEGGSLWNSADCQVLMGVHRYHSATENVYGKDPLNHSINRVSIGRYMGDGVMAAGCKYEIWGVRA